MHKNFLRLAALATAAGMLAPFMASAHTVDSEPGRGGSSLSSWVKAVDGNGDANAIGKFNSNEANKSLVRVNGKVKAVSSTSITVTQYSLDSAGAPVVKDYTFVVDSTTVVIRKFKGTASIAEVSVGDKVGIWATSKIGGTAKLIWDKSIWWVALSGKISDLDATAMSFNLVVTRKESQTGINLTMTVPVRATSSTTFMKADGTVGAWADLANGQNVNVRGTFDRVWMLVWAKKVTIKS